MSGQSAAQHCLDREQSQLVPLIRLAETNDIECIKQIADANRDALGFLPRAKVEEAIARKRVLLALTHDEIVGFVIYRHRKRDQQTTLSDICVARKWRNKGIGAALVQSLFLECKTLKRDCVKLKCPEDLAANSFYEKFGFQRTSIEKGRTRKLFVWQLRVPPLEAV